MNFSLAISLVLDLATLAGPALGSGDDKDKVFVATPLTEERAFTPGIEDPACDAKATSTWSPSPGSPTAARRGV